MEEFLRAGALLLEGDPLYQSLLLTAVLLHFFSEPMRWRIYTRGPEHPPFNRLFHLFNVAALLSFLLPFRLGAPSRLWLIYRLLHLSPGQVSAWMLMDGLIYYAVWGMLALLMATRLAAQETLPPVLRWALLLLLTAGILLLLFLRHRRSNGDGPVSRLLEQARLALLQIQPATLLLALLVILFDLLSHIIRHQAIFLLLQIDLTPAEVSATVIISITTGLLSPLPMGLVGYDAAIVLILGLHGVPVEKALWVPLINRTANLLVALTLGAIGGLQLGVNPFRLRTAGRGDSS